MAIDIFISYSHKDRRLREELDAHLAQLKNDRLIRAWHDGQIGAGQPWEQAISEHLARANVVLLLVSARFLDSTYCYDKELTEAIARHEAGQARVIPIILGQCDWQSAPFAKLQALPKGAKPIVSWAKRDAGWTDVVRGIRAAVKELSTRGHRSPDGANGNETIPPLALPPFVPLADVRTAYRTLHIYHRHLFNLLGQTKGSVAQRVEPLNASFWGSYYFERLPKANPQGKWVYDFIPLAHASFGWSPTRTPEVGGFYFDICHSGDDAVDKDPRDKEPDPTTFPPVEQSKTTLFVYVRGIAKLRNSIGIREWHQIDKLIQGAPNFDDSAWSDGSIHTFSGKGAVIRYGGFALSMEDLANSADIDRLLVKPLLAMIKEARRP